LGEGGGGWGIRVSAAPEGDGGIAYTHSSSPLVHSSRPLLSSTPLIHSSHPLLSLTPVIHSSLSLLSSTPLLHSSLTLLSHTPLTHSSHTLLSSTPLLHSSRALLSYIPRIHSSDTLSFTPLLHPLIHSHAHPLSLTLSSRPLLSLTPVVHSSHPLFSHTYMEAILSTSLVEVKRRCDYMTADDCLLGTPTRYTYTLYLHAIPTRCTYPLYLHTIPTLPLRIHSDGGACVKGTNGFWLLPRYPPSIHSQHGVGEHTFGGRWE
jgi:hypothetical protein